MFVYGLRILVALITFGVGVAASALLSFKRPAVFVSHVRSCESPRVLRVSPAPPPARHAGGGVGWGAADTAEVEGGILNSKARRLPPAVYPSEARAEGVAGTAYVRVVVSESGRVLSARSVGGPELLRQAAVDAARLAEFAPTQLSGRPVKVAGVLFYNFVPE